MGPNDEVFTENRPQNERILRENGARKSLFLPSWLETKKVIRELGKKYGLKNHTDWVRFTKTHNKLLKDLKIPAKPQIYTKERVWGKMKK